MFSAGSGVHREAPNPKLQAPGKLQTSSSRIRARPWCLEHGASLELGAWDLDFMIQDGLVLNTISIVAPSDILVTQKQSPLTSISHGCSLQTILKANYHGELNQLGLY